jgi:hypothetical protein
MQAYLVGLIYRNTRTSCLSLSAVCAHVSHDRLQRMLYQRFAWSRRLWDYFAAGMVREGGYLILDDTAWARWAVRSEAVSWVWSSTHARVLRGHQVVLLIWTDGRVRVPLGIRLWQKGGASKVELAQQLLREAERRGMRPEYVLSAAGANDRAGGRDNHRGAGPRDDSRRAGGRARASAGEQRPDRARGTMNATGPYQQQTLSACRAAQGERREVQRHGFVSKVTRRGLPLTRRALN